VRGSLLQGLLFLGTVVTVLVGIHYYLWRRLVRSTTRAGRGRRVGTWVLIGLAALVPMTLVGSRLLPHTASTVVSWVGYIWLAIMFYLLVTLVVLEIPALVARIVMRRSQRATSAVPAELALVGPAAASGSGPSTATLPSDPPVHPPADTGAPGGAGGPDGESRRLFLSRAVAITAGVASVGLVGSGVGVAMGPPRLRRVPITLPRLPGSADRLKIALVADIHLGPLRGRSHTVRVVEMINDLDADVVAVVGDLVDGSVAELGEAVAPLRELRARYGSYFVTGNHEYYSGHEDWAAELERLGLRVLRNEHEALPVGLDLAGVNDLQGADFGDGPDIGRALNGRDPARPVVLLAHQPAQAPDVARHGVDLQLSGHTHGGQMVPFNLVVKLAQQPVVSGLGEVDGMPVYVTNGAGFWGPPVRVGAPPDISLVELRTP
jgi:uncharacterized protein